MTPAGRRTLIRFTAALAFVVVLVWLMVALESVTTMVMVAFFLAYILNPLTNYLQNRRVPRSIAAFLVVLTGVSCIVAIVLALLPALIGEIVNFASQAPRYFAALHQLALKAAEIVDIRIPENWSQVVDLLIARGREMLPNIAKSATGIVSQVVSSVFRSTMSVLSVVVHVILVPVIAYYLLVSFEDIRKGIVDLIPPYTREPIVDKLRKIDMVLASFIRGQLTIAAILGVLYSLGFIVIGIDLALVIGVVSGILWIVPYLGTLIAVVAGSAMALAQFGDLVHVAYVCFWIAGVQLLESYVLTPKIVGEAIGLHPVVYILALIVGANLFGFVGMLVAIPVTAVLKVLLVSATEAYRASYLYSDGPAETAHDQ
ncbi:MAG: AI-2E family transporter [Desulfomonilaceae bacterium]|nr:AI-2E family transporter [Desulfomonilaceae bacterium]